MRPRIGLLMACVGVGAFAYFGVMGVKSAVAPPRTHAPLRALPTITTQLRLSEVLKHFHFGTDDKGRLMYSSGGSSAGTSCYVYSGGRKHHQWVIRLCYESGVTSSAVVLPGLTA